MDDRISDFSEAAYFHIREFLLNNEYYPGQKIPHIELGKKLGISLTPLREAFIRLSAEGLLIHQSQKGFFIPEIRLKEAKELYEVRLLIEPYMIKKATELIVEDHLKSFHEILKEHIKLVQEPYTRLVQEPYTRLRLLVDKKFHMEIARLANNERLAKILDQVYDQIIIKRRIEHLSSTRGKMAYEEHLDILNVLETKDAKKASQLMREHIEKGSRFVIEEIEHREKLMSIDVPRIVKLR